MMRESAVTCASARQESGYAVATIIMRRYAALRALHAPLDTDITPAMMMLCALMLLLLRF